MCNYTDDFCNELCENPFPQNSCQCEITKIDTKNYCNLICLSSYITSTKLICLCGDKVLKVSYMVELEYMNTVGEKIKVFKESSLIFMNIPENIDPTSMRVSVHSVASLDCCAQEISVRSCAKIYDC